MNYSIVTRGVLQKKVFLKVFAKFTGKYLCQNLFLIQLRASSRPATLLKKSPWHRCLPVSFEKRLRQPFFTEHFRLTTSELCLFRKLSFLFFLSINMWMLFCGVSYSSLHRENDICSLYFFAKTKPLRAHFLENFFLKQIITPLLPKFVCLYTLVYWSKKTSCHYRSYTQQDGQNISGHIRKNITFVTEWKFGELLNVMGLVLFLVVLDKKPNHDLPRLSLSRMSPNIFFATHLIFVKKSF